jgi:preprotein translocase subunit SecA
MFSFITNLFGSKNTRELRRLAPVVASINRIEESLNAKSDEDLLNRTRGWQKYLHSMLPVSLPAIHEINKADDQQLTAWAQEFEGKFAQLRADISSLPKSVSATPSGIIEAQRSFERVQGQFPALRARYLDQILPEAFATVKNAARRLCGKTADVCGQTLTWDMVHFDTQLTGGIALHRGYIAEMATGEGKTLVSTLPVYLNALTGLGVHMVTVNDYLARRDSQWMGFLYSFLGLTVGCIENQMPDDERRKQYLCDITYGTNSEFGFDYLRDNGIATSLDEQVQRGHYFALIDEIDSILIDEARTPLIISGAATAGDETSFLKAKGPVSELYKKQTLLCNELVAQAQHEYEAGHEKEAGRLLFKVKLGQPRNRMFMRLMENPDLMRLVEKTDIRFHRGASKQPLVTLKEELYFVVDRKRREAELMEKGRKFLSPGNPNSFIIPDVSQRMQEAPRPGESRDEQWARVQNELAEEASNLHSINQMLKAYCLFEKDVDYVVRNGEVIIVDEHTGREMPGRRWSDGLHQAVTAKEGLEPEKDNITYATITIQNYFRMYTKLAGMTGTAETEAAEFHDIYKLDVLPIPTNKPCRRVDLNALIFKTRRDKYVAAIARIREIHAKGQPILVGTASVEASETLSRMMQRLHLPHVVLNAKNHMSEAEIVSRAGQKGAITISTNMAGRGTDIKLGEGVAELGGLFVLGTEHYESRRIDRQLRGRAARQGDPGVTQFYISLEDDLLRHFGDVDESSRMIEEAEEEPTRQRIPTSATVENAQRQIEQRNYSWRKHVLDFDDVMNTQREVLYGLRNEILKSEQPQLILFDLLDDMLPDLVASHSKRSHGGFDTDRLFGWLASTFGLTLSDEEIPDDLRSEQTKLPQLVGFISEKLKGAYSGINQLLPPAFAAYFQRSLMLGVIDQHWQEHLSSMEELRDGVNLRSQGQRNPLVEYKKDAYQLFEQLMATVNEEILVNSFRHATQIDRGDLNEQSPDDLEGLPADPRRNVTALIG